MEKRFSIVYVAHPISGDVKGNLEKIKNIIRQINLTEPGVVPFAHYWIDCYALDNTKPEERSRGIKNDIAFLKAGFIDEMRLYGYKISYGMRCEIDVARSIGIPIIPMTEGTKEDFKYLS